MKEFAEGDCYEKKCGGGDDAAEEGTCRSEGGGYDAGGGGEEGEPDCADKGGGDAPQAHAHVSSAADGVDEHCTGHASGLGPGDYVESVAAEDVQEEELDAELDEAYVTDEYGATVDFAYCGEKCTDAHEAFGNGKYAEYGYGGEPFGAVEEFYAGGRYGDHKHHDEYVYAYYYGEHFAHEVSLSLGVFFIGCDYEEGGVEGVFSDVEGYVGKFGSLIIYAGECGGGIESAEDEGVDVASYYGGEVADSEVYAVAEEFFEGFYTESKPWEPL